MNQKGRKENEDNTLVLNNKVKDLENEVTKLKKRLEDLRRAKSNTILKREREIVQVGGLNAGRPAGVETSKYKELERKLHESEKKNNELQLQCQEIEKDKNQWKKKFENLETEMTTLKEAHKVKIAETSNECREHKARADDVSNELERLRERLEIKSMHEENKKRENNQRGTYIADLINENTTLRVKNEQFLIQLSEKEAMWLQNEELMIKKIQEKWDEKYAKWMSATEKRIEELRAANLVLKQCLAKRDGRFSEEAPSTSGSGLSNQGKHT